MQNKKRQHIELNSQVEDKATIECGLGLPTPTSCAKATEVKKLRRAGIAEYKKPIY
jgi:hypothetical protein